MIIVVLKGGLGNQMFQYATGRALSLIQQSKTGTEVSLQFDFSNYQNKSDPGARIYGLNNFNIPEKVASNADILRLRYPKGVLSIYFKKIRTKLGLLNVGFIPRILKKNGDVYLDGYWQTEKYFRSIREILLRDFALRKPFSTSARGIEASILREPNSVSLHVRRTDYSVNEQNIRIFGNHCDQEYYTKALSEIAKRINSTNLHVFVFSDDIEWVKDHIDINFNKTYISETSAPDYELMILMSVCKYHIIANSTFGWWGAWLDQKPNKIVIAPSVWIPGLKLSISDIIPPEWIKI
ncbi:MAG: alpha-1,2-fucosyltransferase [Candidatus Taylorbacteria bacterium]